MIKTQIEIPEDLYKDLKGLAKRKEWYGILWTINQSGGLSSGDFRHE